MIVVDIYLTDLIDSPQGRRGIRFIVLAATIRVAIRSISIGRSLSFATTAVVVIRGNWLKQYFALIVDIRIVHSSSIFQFLQFDGLAVGPRSITGGSSFPIG